LSIRRPFLQTTDAVSGTVSKVLREPLLHFTLAAAALFAIAAMITPDSQVIAVSRQELDYRILQVEAQEGTKLNDQERRLVEDAYIDERVLVREAEKMGLEADQRIDDILVQKMLQVLSGDVIQPTDEELAAFFEQNRSSYRTDPSVTIDELVLPVDTPLPKALREGAAPEDLPEGSFVDHRVMDRLTRAELGQIYGAEGADVIIAAEPGVWIRAVKSVRGQYWLRVRERFDAETPELSVVRDQVRLDWISNQEQARLLDRVAVLREHYEIDVEGR
jgi:hypothetical protein